MRYTSPPVEAPPVPAHREERPLAGIAFNAAAFAAVSVGDVLSKLALAFMPTVQMVSVRTAFLLLLLAPWFYRAVQQGDPPWRTQRLGLHLIRVAVQITSIVTFLTALRHLPISTITAIAFMTPIFVALFARVVLGEKLGWGQLISIVIGFAGCMIILRPGTADFSPYMLLALYACMSWAFALVLLRSLTRTDSIAKIMFIQNMTIFVGAAAFTPAFWMPMDWSVWMIMLGIGIVQVIGQATSAKALTLARAATVAPVQYTQLLWVTALGWFVFSEWPGSHVWLGVALIILSGLWLIRSQRAAA